jgi:hypothetical protein
MSNAALAAVNTINVNIYCLATFKVKANSVRDAAVIAVNSPIQWVMQCDKYKVTWSVNDCMMIDVSSVDGSETDEFNYYSVYDVEGHIPTVGDHGKIYEVDMYFNLEVEVDDADDDEDAIAKADDAEITGEPITSLDVKWTYSESLESSVVE